MKNLTRSLALVLSLGLAVAASAQPSNPDGEHRGPGRGGPRGPGGPGRPGHPVLRVVDADKDRTISAAEIEAAPTAIAALDADSDGTVTFAELRPTPPLGGPGRRGGPRGPGGPDGPRRGKDGRGKDSGQADPRGPAHDPVMLALDANSDGVLSGEEIGNAGASLKALDGNADGELTPDEVRPLPPQKSEG